MHSRSWKLNVSARNSARRAVAWMVMVGVLMIASSAWAKKRVVVLSFSGPQGGKAEAAVAGAIKKRHTIVSQAQYTKAQKKLKAKKQTDKNVAKIAAEIQVDAVVSGSVKKKAGKLTVSVVVREGVSGQVKGSASFVLRGNKVDQKAKNEIDEQVLPLVDDVRGISEGGSAMSSGDDSGSVSADEPKKKGKKGNPEEETTPPTGSGSDDTGEQEAVPGVDDTKKVASTDGSESSPDSSVSKSSDGGEVSSSPQGDDHYARNGAFDVSLGVSALQRTLSFTVADGLANGPAGYDGALVPGALLEGEVYPMGFGKKTGVLANIGLTFMFDRVFVLKSKTMDTEYDTTQQRYGLGLRYRWLLGSSTTSPTVHFGIGYNNLAFTIDSGGKDIGLPNVEYSFVDPGAGIRMPLGTPSFALLADARYMIVLGAGDIASADNYGGGTVAGLDIDAGLEWRLMPRLPIRVGFKYVRIAYTFEDNGGKRVNNQDNNPATQDVGGALDTYLGGYATAGYIF
jgi:hypothetical protein